MASDSLGFVYSLIYTLIVLWRRRYSDTSNRVRW